MESDEWNALSRDVSAIYLKCVEHKVVAFLGFLELGDHLAQELSEAHKVMNPDHNVSELSGKYLEDLSSPSYKLVEPDFFKQ